MKLTKTSFKARHHAQMSVTKKKKKKSGGNVIGIKIILNLKNSFLRKKVGKKNIKPEK